MKTLKQIFTNKKLRNSILFTILILIIYKVGTMVRIPTVSNVSNIDSSVGWLTVMSYLSGSYLTKFTVFSLGLSPYITASIIVQLLGMGVIPAFTRWKDEGEAGHKKQERATIILGVIMALFESIILVWSFDKMYGIIAHPGFWGYLFTTLFLFGGALMTMWLAHLITKKGIGNGSSLIIFAGIAAHIGYDVLTTAVTILNYATVSKGILTTILFALYIIFYIVLIGFIVLIDKSHRDIRVQYAKQAHQFSNPTSTIPIKVNIGGVIPIIFTSSVLIGLAYIGALTHQTWLMTIANYTTVLGLIIYLCLVMFFSLFYASEVFNAKDIAKNIKKSNAIIVGKLPGKETEEYVDSVIRDIAIVGGTALCLIAAIPIIVAMIFPNLSLALSLGGTSVMILAGVASETTGQIKAKISTAKSTNLKLFD